MNTLRQQIQGNARLASNLQDASVCPTSGSASQQIRRHCLAWMLTCLLIGGLAAANPPDRDTEGPGQGDSNGAYLTDRDTEGPGQGDLQGLRIAGVDLRFAGKLRLGGMDLRWSARSLAAPLVLVARGDRCVLPIRFGVVNAGGRASPPYRIVLRQVPDSSPGGAVRPWTRSSLDQPMQPGGSERQVRTELSLMRGDSWLQIDLDSEQAVGESSESNNQRRLALRIEANCVAALRQDSGPARRVSVPKDRSQP